MKGKLYLQHVAVLGLLCFIINSAGATIYRVGYTGPQHAGTDYTTLDDAYSASAAGDTIMFYPGNWILSNPASKKLVYLGYGYYNTGANSNSGLQIISGTLYVSIYLDAGSDESVFEGIGGESGELAVRVNPGSSVNNIQVRRCVVDVSPVSDMDCDGWTVTQSYIFNVSPSAIGGKTTNLRIENCYVSQINLSNVGAGSTGQIKNCVMYNIVYMDNSSFNFENNIFVAGGLTNISSCVFQYCLFANDAAGLGLTPGNNNQFSVDMSTVFAGYPTQGSYSNDGLWQLSPGSPATGAGSGGVDCGMFGGSNPYRLSGMPAIPAFYKLTAASTNATSNPYNITFSVRSSN